VNREEPLLTPDEVIEALQEQGAFPPREKHRLIDHALGIASFLFILVAAFAVATGFTVDDLLEHEEAARLAWGRVIAQQQRREALVADLVEQLGEPVRGTRAYRDWAQALAGAAGAQIPIEEVAAQRQVQAALDDLLGVLERSAAAGPPEAHALLHRVEGTILLLEVERERYDQAVARYRRMAERPPGRWLARLIGLRNIDPWTPL